MRGQLEKKVEAILPDTITPLEAGRLITQIMRRTRWDQDTIDQVLGALSIPFAARRLRLQTVPILLTDPPGKEKSLICLSGHHEQCGSTSCVCVCHKPLDARVRR